MANCRDGQYRVVLCRGTFFNLKRHFSCLWNGENDTQLRLFNTLNQGGQTFRTMGRIVKSFKAEGRSDL